ncbi:MAG: hypothetical protein AAF307_14005 [Pseudomonadota bacterium]
MSNAAAQDGDAQTLSLIRGMLTEEAEAKPARVAAATRPAALKRTARPTATAAQSMRRVSGLSFSNRRRIRLGVGVGVVALLLLLRPLLLLALIVLPLIVITGLFAVLGADRVWGGVLTGLRRYMDRDPDAGMALVARLDQFAERWDAILDRFPDGTVDGLYLPDLQSILPQ